jgi:hypothetical protein
MSRALLGQRFLAVVGGDHVKALQAQVERNQADDVLVVVGDQHHVAHGLVPFQRLAQRRVIAYRPLAEPQTGRTPPLLRPAEVASSRVGSWVAAVTS